MGMVSRLGVTSSRHEPSSAPIPGLNGKSVASSARSVHPPLVLFLCRSNATCSIMAEAILKHRAKDRLRAASAGETPYARVDPYTLECLSAHGVSTKGLRSKTWGEYFGLDRPRVRFVIALCDLYAARANWPEDTLIARWDMPDPGTVVGSEVDIRVAFEETYGRLDSRIRQFLALPLGGLNAPALALEIQRIGETW